MAVVTLATFQRFRWLLVAAVLSFIAILLTLRNGWLLIKNEESFYTDAQRSDIGGHHLIPFRNQGVTASSGRSVLNIPLRILPVGDSVTQGYEIDTEGT